MINLSNYWGASYCDELYTYNKADFQRIQAHTPLKITILSPSLRGVWFGTLTRALNFYASFSISILPLKEESLYLNTQHSFS